VLDKAEYSAYESTLNSSIVSYRITRMIFREAYWLYACFTTVAWLSFSALVSINGFTLCLAQLVLGWVTVCG